MRRLVFTSGKLFWLQGSVASLLAIVIGGIAFDAFADQAPAPLISKEESDWQLEIRVRQTLRDVPDFAPYRLGVTVQTGIAKVWGSVPSKDLMESISTTVRKVNGIQEVRNEVKVVRPPDDLPERIAKAVVTNTPVQQTPIPPTKTTEAIVRVPNKAPVVTTSQNSTTMKQSETNIVMKPSPQKEVDLHQWMETIRRSDLRYREIRWSFENGIVRLEGFVERKSDVWDLADRISDLSGVRRVLVDRVKSR